jgi:very-short-patch-repair endonuclease
LEQLNNIPELKTFRRELRSNLTPAEAKLWSYLQRKQLDGRKFRRQHSIGGYILDFYCPQEQLAIELDGQPHFSSSAAQYDQERDLFLSHFGVLVLRFINHHVFDNPQGILGHIRNHFGWYLKK